MRVKAIIGVVFAALIVAVGVSTLSADEKSDLAKRVADLERKMSAIESRMVAIEPASPALENEAKTAFTQINTLMSQGKFDQAKALGNQFQTKYSKTAAYNQYKRIEQELGVFGKAAPAKWGIDKWFQGESQVDLASDKTTLLVFWELWCPHCKREVPKMQAIYDNLKGDGLQMIGLTRLTRSSTEDAVKDFVSQQKVSYPIAKEDGTVATHFGVSGIPAAAVVKDGKVIWRGHPAKLSEGMLKGWL